MKVFAIVDYKTDEEICWAKNIHMAQRMAQRMSINGFYYAVVAKDIPDTPIIGKTNKE